MVKNIVDREQVVHARLQLVSGIEDVALMKAALARGAVHLTADALATGAEARSSLAERLMKLWGIEARRNPADRHADEHAQACVVSKRTRTTR